jgi:hypothetical protein
LSWLDEPFRLGELSLFGRQGVNLALVLRDTGLTIVQLVPTLAEDGNWHERKVRRRLARARAEILSQRRCECGCKRRIPRYSRADRETATDACQKRLQRRRRPQKTPPPRPRDGSRLIEIDNRPESARRPPTGRDPDGRPFSSE